ncbi:Glucosaminyl phosphatidylinositol (GlcN-PI) nositol acylation protein [Ascosphaera aggregata]|nr:Glucosaminyl phosphatidylinositol (GlcN-PI) nositol acylation protein [Ascosphaera aggregata]
MSTSYKSRKVDFAAILLWSALQSRKSFFSQKGVAPLIVDILLNIGTILVAITIYSSIPVTLNILLVSPAVILYLTTPGQHKTSSPRHTNGKDKKNKNKNKNKKDETTSEQLSSFTAAATPPSSAQLDQLPVRPFITTYRGAMLIITCLAILAVDFRIFPRRFAKVETWGTSLMDLGVGSFVFSGGIVSARQVLKEKRRNAHDDDDDDDDDAVTHTAAAAAETPPKREHLTQRLLAATRHSVPLLVLGFVRLYSVKGLDYAEHVTEYGVHWNFFFTLALLGPFVEIFHSATRFIPSYEALALLIAVAYQVILESTSLKEYILLSPRNTSLLAKNREGVFSFIGYLAIFLAGRATGMQAIPRDQRSRDPRVARKRLLIRLAVWSAIWTALFYLNSYHAFGFGAGIAVSRRMANMPYVLWTAAFNNSQLFLFCLIETVFFPSVYRSATQPVVEQEAVQFATSRVMDAYNKNGLAIFLLSNLLTGSVNLGINTLDAGRVTSMMILVSYAGVLTMVALMMDKYGLKVKL